MKALLAVASGDGVSSGEEEDDDFGEPTVSGEVGEGKPELPKLAGLPGLPMSEALTLAGRPCWKRHRVP